MTTSKVTAATAELLSPATPWAPSKADGSPAEAGILWGEGLSTILTTSKHRNSTSSNHYEASVLNQY